MEAEIFTEIKEAEKKADEIIEEANLDSERIVQEARNKASKMLAQELERIDKEKSDKIMEFKGKVHVLRETKISEGKESLKILKQNAQKNRDAAVELVIKKFYDIIK